MKEIFDWLREQCFENVKIGRCSFAEIYKIIGKAGYPHPQIPVILRLDLGAEQILFGNIGQLEMYTAVFKRGFDKRQGDARGL